MISHAAYGKDGVRVVTWTPDAVRDATLRVDVEGSFLASYRSGDNAAILPSDTLRRHALAACDALPGGTVEALLSEIGSRVLGANAALTAVTASARVRRWERLGEHSFVLGPGEATATVRTGVGCCVRSGVSGLTLLSTTGSAFTGFMRDALTTQEPAADRPLCGSLDASWTYVGDRLPAAGLTAAIVERLLAAFADRPSNAIQQLVTEVGSEVMGATPELAGIALRFESLGVAPIPGASGTAHELGGGAIGVTDVVLRQ